MKNFLKLLVKLSILAILGIGLFKSYGLYKQNLLGRSMSKKAPLLVELPFVIIIPAQNPGLLVEKTLISALSQNYSNFRVIYLDDKSTDGSFEQVQALIQFLKKEDKTLLLQNERPQGTLKNIHQTVLGCDSREIVVIVRACDFLAHEEVLNKLNTLYSNPFTWMTYGNYLNYPSYKQMPIHCKEFPKNIVFNNAYRSLTIPPLCPLTFYAGLFKEIPLEDFLYKGKFIQIDAPLAYELPLLEISGTHAHFVNEILYLYNQKDLKTTPSEILHFLQNLPKQEKLKSLPFIYQKNSEKNFREKI